MSNTRPIRWPSRTAQAHAQEPVETKVKLPADSGLRTDGDALPSSGPDTAAGREHAFRRREHLIGKRRARSKQPGADHDERRDGSQQIPERAHQVERHIAGQYEVAVISALEGPVARQRKRRFP